MRSLPATGEDGLTLSGPHFPRPEKRTGNISCSAVGEAAWAAAFERKNRSWFICGSPAAGEALLTPAARSLRELTDRIALGLPARLC